MNSAPVIPDRSTMEWLSSAARIVHGEANPSGQVGKPLYRSFTATTLHPFQVFQHSAATPAPTTDWRTVRVHYGEIFNSSDSSWDHSPDNDDSAATPLDIVVPASSDLYKVWLEIPVSSDGDVLTVNG
jgi:hypothetical protein